MKIVPDSSPIDENCPRLLAEGLRRRGADVSTTPEVGLLHSADLSRIEYAFSQNRVIFTQDQDFLAIHASGVEHAGIVYWRMGSRSIGEMIRGLILIWEIYDHDEIVGKIEYLESRMTPRFNPLAARARCALS